MTPVILYSGGLDSFVLAVDLIQNPWRYGFAPGTLPALIHFTASDKSHEYTTTKFREQQVPYLEHLTDRPIPIKVISTDGLLESEPMKKPRAEALVLNHRARFHGHDIGRQVLFMSLAFNYASSLDSDVVMAAFQMDPKRWAPYDEDPWNDVSDDNPTFRDSINALTTSGGFVPGQRLVTPFLDSRMSKIDIIRLGLGLAAPLQYTYSCVFTGPVPCGKCNACKIYNRAVKELGYDPRTIP